MTQIQKKIFSIYNESIGCTNFNNYNAKKKSVYEDFRMKCAKKI